jgi:signal peptidase II
MTEDIETRHTNFENSPASHRRSWHKDPLLILTIPAILAVDQLTKFVVTQNLGLGQSWPAEGFFRFTYGLNTGTAFGLLPNQTTLLIIASFVAIGFLVYFYRSHAMPSRLLRLAIGLQLGGAFGNLIDRLRSGAVVDFIDVGPWPIFNIADSSIVVGMAILITVLILGDIKQKETPPDSTEAEPSGSQDDSE